MAASRAPITARSISNGLRQVVDLHMTWVINSGGGKISFEIRMSATDNIFNATSGSFVALYTSTSNGKFDVNACPEEGGVARGTYSFQTKHEMNDVSGAANARSGAGRAVDAPFTSVRRRRRSPAAHGDDARHGCGCSRPGRQRFGLDRCVRLDRLADRSRSS